IPGSFRYNQASGTVLAAGTQTLTAVFTPADPVNYASQNVSAALTVNKAPLSVTATSASRAYNTPNPSFTGTITGGVNGDSFTESFSTTAGVSSPAGTYPITPTATGPALANYTVTLSPGTLTVTPASTSSAITWTPAALTYGTGLGAGQLNASSTIPGSFRYNQASGTVLAAGNQTLTAVFTPADPVNYAPQNVSAALTVNKAPLSVSAANASRAYGTSNPTLSASATGAVNSDTFTFAESTTATISSAPGAYPISPVAMGANLSNYNITYANGTLTVGQATLTVTAASAARAYGAANPTFSATIVGATNGDTFTLTESTTAAPSSPIGTYAIVPVATGPNLADYSVVYVNGSLAVGQAPLTVTAAGASRAFGAANPPFSGSASGAVNGDTFTFAESTTANVGSPVGIYPIVPLATGTNLANYNVVYVNGTLTVGRATLTITAANASRAYGTGNPTFSASAAGAANGDTFTFAESTTANPSSAVGAYSIIPVATGSNLGNYNVVYVNGTLTVGQATLTVTADNANRAYGIANPTFSATANGALNGDTFTFAESTTATASSPIGSYPIVPVVTGANLSNYTVAYINGTLTVGKAALTVTAADASRSYGAANPTFSALGVGAANGDTFTFSESTSATIASPAGTYSIIPVATGANLANYTVTYVNGTLTIGKATLTVTAADATRSYGQSNPVFSASAMGVANADTFSFTESTSATSASPIGPYPIIPVVTGANLANYTVVYVNGTLTIGKATLVVTAADANRTYGAANPTFSSSASGAADGDTFSFAESTNATVSSPVGAYSIVPIATGTNLANYNVVYTNGTLIIAQALLKVTAGDASRTYGVSNPPFSAAAAGALNGDTFSFTESTSATATSPVGNYAILPLATGADLADYNVVYVNGTLTVGQATLNVTADSTNRIYGAPNPIFSATASGAVNGDTFSFTESTTADATSPVGSYPIIPTATGTNIADYNVTYTPGTLTVAKAVLTVTAADATRAYDVANPIFSTSSMGAANGDTFTFTDTTAATLTSPAGTYPIVPAASGTNLSNYTVQYVTGILTITQAAPLITWTPPAPIVFGTPLSTTQLDATATISGVSIPGTMTYTPAVGTIPVAGADTLSVTFNPTDSTDYLSVTKSVQITINQYTPAITWTNPVSISYGTPLTGTQLNAAVYQPNSSIPIPGTLVYSPASGTDLMVGNHTLSVTFVPADTTDYTSATATATLLVTQATLTISADNFSRLYGAANPTFTGTVTGMKDNDTFAETFSNMASITSQPGQYPILPAVSGSNLTDYVQTVQNGHLTIAQAPVIATTSLSATSIVSGLNASITTTVQSTTTGTPTGTVNFFDNGKPLASTTLNNGIATYNSSTLSVGTHVILAVYSGDIDFSSNTASAASGGNTIIITPLDFTFQLTSQSTVEGTYGTTRQFTFHIAPTGGSYPDVVQLTASPSGPILATYTFSPASIDKNGGAMDITLTVATEKLASLEQRRDPSSRLSPVAIGLFLLPLFGLRYSRRSGSKLAKLVSHSLLILLSLGAIGTLTGCGSGYFDHVYPISVTAASGNIQHSANVDFHIDKAPQ
ncbi:MAG: Ig-like domain repeat protein, partial [Acidobacteriota bacterium]|nr:Ig-like domain repeat protein [Acidobacteriota bacterium]